MNAGILYAWLQTEAVRDHRGRLVTERPAWSIFSSGRVGKSFLKSGEAFQLGDKLREAQGGLRMAGGHRRTQPT